MRMVAFAMVAPALLWGGMAVAESPSGSQGRQAGSKADPHSMKGGQAADATTDLTGGKTGTPDEYADTPVRQGSLVEVKDSQWVNKKVKSSQGNTLGTVEQILKDQKTGDIEYAVLSFKDSDRLVPMRWSQFKPQGDGLQINMKEEEFKQTINSFSPEDTSPDVRMYMKQIDQVRKAPKAGASKGSGTATGQPAAAGPMGEEATGGGVSGNQGLPPGKAPGHEGDNPSSKN